MMELQALLQLHDELLAEQPSGAVHESTECPLCALDGTVEFTQGGDDLSTFTQEDIDAAVSAALAPLTKELEEFKVSHAETEIEARIAAVKAEMETKISDLQAELDSAVLKASEAEKQYGDLVAFLDTQKTEQEAAAQLAVRKEDRISVVKEVASFPDEYLTANADRWAALADEDFEALVEDWKVISTAKRESGGIPTQTSMVASRGNDTAKSAISEVLSWNLQGIDPARV